MSYMLLAGIFLSFAVLIIALALSRKTRSASVVSSVTRGSAAWEYFYLTFGFSLTVEAGVVALILPLHWPANLMAFALMAGCTIYLWLNGWFQNKLLGWKARYEQRQTDPEAAPILGCAVFAIAFVWLVVWARLCLPG